MSTNSRRWVRGWVPSLTLSLLILAVGLQWPSPPAESSATSHSAAYGVQPDDLGRVIATSDIIVEGVVTAVEPSVWTTRTRNPPARVEEMLVDDSIQLRTPVQLHVDQVHKGSAVSSGLYFTMPGGTSDLVDVSSPLGTPPEPGQRVLVFLSKAPAKAGPWSEISPLYPQLILTVDGSTLIGPDKTVARSQVVQELRSAQQ